MKSRQSRRARARQSIRPLVTGRARLLRAWFCQSDAQTMDYHTASLSTAAWLRKLPERPGWSHCYRDRSSLQQGRLNFKLACRQLEVYYSWPILTSLRFGHTAQPDFNNPAVMLESRRVNKRSLALVFQGTE